MTDPVDKTLARLEAERDLYLSLLPRLRELIETLEEKPGKRRRVCLARPAPEELPWVLRPDSVLPKAERLPILSGDRDETVVWLAPIFLGFAGVFFVMMGHAPPKSGANLLLTLTTTLCGFMGIAILWESRDRVIDCCKRGFSKVWDWLRPRDERSFFGLLFLFFSLVSAYAAGYNFFYGKVLDMVAEFLLAIATVAVGFFLKSRKEA